MGTEKGSCIPTMLRIRPMVCPTWPKRVTGSQARPTSEARTPGDQANWVRASDDTNFFSRCFLDLSPPSFRFTTESRLLMFFLRGIPCFPFLSLLYLSAFDLFGCNCISISWSERDRNKRCHELFWRGLGFRFDHCTLDRVTICDARCLRHKNQLCIYVPVT